MVLDLHRSPRGAREPGTRKLLSGVRILVVEGEPDARELLEAVFSYCGALVTLTGSAREALAQAQATAPDVIVSDVGLPGDDGYGFVRRLRALEGSTGAVPVVILAAGREHTPERARSAGFDAHVRKPVEPWELCRIVAGLARKA